MAVSIAALASSPACRQVLVDQGAVELIVQLSNSTNPGTCAQCALALGYLSGYTRLEKGTASKMVSLAPVEPPPPKDSKAGDSGNDSSGTVKRTAEGKLSSPSSPSSPPLKLKNVVMKDRRKILALGRRAKAEMTEEEETKALDAAQQEEMDEIAEAERHLLFHDFEKQVYKTITFDAPLVSGDTARPLTIQLPYPVLSDTRQIDPPERTSDITSVPVEMSFAPKSVIEPKVQPPATVIPEPEVAIRETPKIQHSPQSSSQSSSRKQGKRTASKNKTTRDISTMGSSPTFGSSRKRLGSAEEKTKSLSVL
jgi:hypothetical protein